MRLIDTTSFDLKEFVGLPGQGIPPYAILSHTWGREEVSFEDIVKDKANAREKLGFSKVEGCCRQARRDHLEWAWIDTCCIDKKSSAELSEALNSMFKWYEGASVCYTYLEDLDLEDIGPDRPLEESLRECRWFTRGWTLQELLASKTIQFYDRNWNLVGSTFHRKKNEFLTLLSNITGIEELYLAMPAALPMESVATRMSWAAKRETTRAEDGAYSLMGIFGVNMPILYGEGIVGAFQRLQLQILEKTPDQSIFAWKANGLSRNGLLAPSPSCFLGSKFTTNGKSTWTQTIQKSTVTNMGIEINVPMVGVGRDDIFSGSLRCWKMPNDSSPPMRVQILLRKLKATSQGSIVNLYQRVECNSLPLATSNAYVGRREDIFVLNNEQADHAILIGAVESFSRALPDLTWL